jgi:Tol biopolymer transport system component
MHKRLSNVAIVVVVATATPVVGQRSAGLQVGPASRFRPTSGLDVARIAFTRKVYLTNESGSDTTDVWVMNADGSNRRNLTRNPAWLDSRPDWSPDGRSIAFIRFPDIWVMNADGSGQRRLTRGRKGEDWDPTWSPDGKKLAFVREGIPNAIWVMNADGSGARQLIRGSVIRESDWSPDGRVIAFVRSTGWADTTKEIYLANADNGGGLRRLTRNRVEEIGPTWSPDGKKITFWRRDGIYVMNADGSRIRRLARRGEEPAWSSDGKHLAYVRDLSIYVMKADGTKQRRLVRKGSRVEYRYPAWSPTT